MELPLDLNLYRFRSTWHVAASPGDCFEVLHDFVCYPRWWPEVKQVVQTSDETASVTIRAALPYSLVFEMTRQTSDPARGILQASMSGDLDGWSRWEVSESATGTSLEFHEEASVNKPALRRIALVGRPVFRLNHAVMMWRGERGLRRYLSSLGSEES